MIVLNQSIKIMQNYADTDSFMRMFMKALQMIPKKDLMHQGIKLIDHCLRERPKK